MTKGVTQVFHADSDVVRPADLIARIHVFSEVSDGLMAMVRALYEGNKFEVVVK